VEERKLNLVRRKIGRRKVNRQSVTDYKDREIEVKFSLFYAVSNYVCACFRLYVTASNFG
jgi:hypothetical protein